MTHPPLRARRTRRSSTLSALLLLCVPACTPGASEDSAVRRGDEAFARDSLQEALAEYRLAVSQGAEEPEVFARVAHTYIALGRVEEGADYFGRAAARDARWGDMGVSDLVRLARDAAEREDRFQMASAMEAARKIRPGLSVADLTLPLARHYLEVGEFERALPLYQKALDEASSPTPALVFEVGEAHLGVDDCRGALVFFNRYQSIASPRDGARAAWNIGDCSFRLARDLRMREGAARNLDEALRHINRAIEVGEPRSVQGEAWYEKGEILNDLGQCDAALESFAQVRFYESSPSPLVQRAESRIEDIRLSKDLVGIRGKCS